MVQAVLKQNLGIEVELRAVEWGDYLTGLSRREYGLYLLAWGADWPEPSSFLDSLFRSDSPENHLAFNDPQVDAALDQAAAERDPAKRNQLYAQVEQTILASTPVVPLLHSVDYLLAPALCTWDPSDTAGHPEPARRLPDQPHRRGNALILPL